MNNLDANNKTAAFHIYADLSEVKNYGKLIAKFCEQNKYISFESETNTKEAEIILPIDENDPKFCIDLIKNIVKKHNENNPDKLGIIKYSFFYTV
ncbi:hypothetical protein BpHYR1_051528 [Brachionus plicatilis]|uniref:Uncharacterized protein n=1 Tax=Brachionus plicatilis TaxID=10195 RepID=A0A3M7R8V6_BRAPC|nr:hypothetical protein BpHYR1_051528 [Brachionus plicatilis]